MCCGNTCTKYLMFLFNFVFALGGIALLVVGALTQAQIAEVNNFLDGKFSAPPIVLIVLGSVIFVIAFFGCCGAIRESTCMLTTFAVFLILILVAGVAIAIVAFIFKDDFTDGMANTLRTAVQNYDAHRESVDAIQQALRCCGVDGPADYNSLNLPASCCDKQATICTTVSFTSLYNTGCAVKLKEFINFSGALLGGLAIGVAVIMLIGIILSLGLVRTIKRSISV